MDYAYAPPKPKPDADDARLQLVTEQFYDHRQHTTLLNRPPGDTVRLALNSLEEFVQFVNDPNELPRPLGYLIIDSHANNTGWLEIPLGPDAKGRDTQIDYDTLHNFPGSIALAPARFAPETGKVIIWGCRIGQAKPFVDLLKSKLGGQVTVVAPKHFAGYWSVPKRGAVVAYLAYGFTLSTPEKIKKRSDLVMALKTRNPSFEYFDRAPVPNGNWTNWLPKTSNNKLPKHKSTRMIPLSLGFNKPDLFPTEFRIRPDTEEAFIALAGNQQPPKTQEELRNLMLQEYPNLNFPKYQDPPVNPFPIYAREGFETLKKYLDSFKWRVKKKKSKGKTVFVGTRYEYTLIVPITEPTTTDAVLHLLVKVDGSVSTTPDLPIELNTFGFLYPAPELFLTV